MNIFPDYNFNTSLNGYKDLLLYQSGLNNGSTCSSCSGSSTGELIGNLLGGALAIGMTAAVANSQNKASSKASAAANKQVSAGAQAVINAYPAKVGAAVNSFNSKYSSLGATISETGVPTKSYAQMKADIQSQIDNLKKSVNNNKTKDNTDHTDGTGNVQNYNTLKSVYNSLTSAKQNYENLESSKKQIQENNTEKITVNNDTATAKKINWQNYTQYLSEDEQKLSEQEQESRAKNTQAYRNELASREQVADQYNNMAKNQKQILATNKLQSVQDFEQKINDAKAEMDKAGENKISDNGITVSQYDAALSDLESKLSALGTQADFDAAVKEITDINAEYKEATAIKTAEATATEDANAAATSKRTLKKAKQGGHTGLRGKFYDWFHKDKNSTDVMSAKVNANDAAQRSASSQAALEQLYSQYLQ